MVAFRANSVWWTRRMRCAAVVGLTSISLLSGDTSHVFAEWFARPKVPKLVEPTEPQSNTGFDTAIRKLLKEAKAAENKGEIDRALILAERAAKISESSSSLVKSAQDVSPAATAAYARVLRYKRSELVAKQNAAEAANGQDLAAARSRNKAAQPSEKRPDVGGKDSVSTDSDAKLANTGSQNGAEIASRSRLKSSQNSNLPSKPQLQSSENSAAGEGPTSQPAQSVAQTNTAADPQTETQDDDWPPIPESKSIAQTNVAPSAEVSGPKTDLVINLGSRKSSDQTAATFVTPVSSSNNASPKTNDLKDIRESVAGANHQDSSPDFDSIRPTDESVLPDRDERQSPDESVETTPSGANPSADASNATVEPSFESNVSEEITRPRDLRKSISIQASDETKESENSIASSDKVRDTVIEPGQTGGPLPRVKLRQRYQETDLLNSESVPVPQPSEVSAQVKQNQTADDAFDSPLSKSIPTVDVAVETPSAPSVEISKAEVLQSESTPRPVESTSTPIAPAPFKIRAAYRNSTPKFSPATKSASRQLADEWCDGVPSAANPSSPKTTEETLSKPVETDPIQPDASRPIKLRTSFRDPQMTRAVGKGIEKPSIEESQTESTISIASHDSSADSEKKTTPVEVSAEVTSPPPASFKLRTRYRDPQLIPDRDEKIELVEAQPGPESTRPGRQTVVGRSSIVHWRSANDSRSSSSSEKVASTERSDSSAVRTRTSKSESEKPTTGQSRGTSESFRVGSTSTSSSRIGASSSTGARMTKADVEELTARQERRGSKWDGVSSRSLESQSERNGTQSTAKTAPTPPPGDGVLQTSFSKADGENKTKKSESADRLMSSSGSDAAAFAELDSGTSSASAPSKRIRATEDDHASATRSILSSGPIQRITALTGIPNSAASAMLGVFGMTLLLAGLWMVRATIRTKST